MSLDVYLTTALREERDAHPDVIAHWKMLAGN
jgi:hypothetical protein